MNVGHSLFNAHKEFEFKFRFGPYFIHLRRTECPAFILNLPTSRFLMACLFQNRTKSSCSFEAFFSRVPEWLALQTNPFLRLCFRAASLAPEGWPYCAISTITAHLKMENVKNSSGKTFIADSAIERRHGASESHFTNFWEFCIGTLQVLEQRMLVRNAKDLMFSRNFMSHSLILGLVSDWVFCFATFLKVADFLQEDTLVFCSSSSLRWGCRWSFEKFVYEIIWLKFYFFKDVCCVWYFCVMLALKKTNFTVYLWKKYCKKLLEAQQGWNEEVNVL